MKPVIYKLKAASDKGDTAEAVIESGSHYDALFFFFTNHLDSGEFQGELETLEMKKINGDELPHH